MLLLSLLLSLSLWINQTQVNQKKLEQYLRTHVAYPNKYRPLIWRFLLRLPENTEAFQALALRGIHPSFEGFNFTLLSNPSPLHRPPGAAAASTNPTSHSHSPCLSVPGILGSDPLTMARLQRTCSQLAYWSPHLDQLDYLPELVCPLVQVHGMAWTHSRLLSSHPINPPARLTHLLTHAPSNPHYQRSLSTHPFIRIYTSSKTPCLKNPINTPHEHNSSTHPIKHPINTPF